MLLLSQLHVYHHHHLLSLQLFNALIAILSHTSPSHSIFHRRHYHHLSIFHSTNLSFTPTPNFTCLLLKDYNYYRDDVSLSRVQRWFLFLTDCILHAQAEREEKVLAFLCCLVFVTVKWQEILAERDSGVAFEYFMMDGLNGDVKCYYASIFVTAPQPQLCLFKFIIPLVEVKGLWSTLPCYYFKIWCWVVLKRKSRMRHVSNWQMTDGFKSALLLFFRFILFRIFPLCLLLMVSVNTWKRNSYCLNTEIVWKLRSNYFRSSWNLLEAFLMYRPVFFLLFLKSFSKEIVYSTILAGGLQIKRRKLNSWRCQPHETKNYCDQQCNGVLFLRSLM